MVIKAKTSYAHVSTLEASDSNQDIYTPNDRTEREDHTSLGLNLDRGAGRSLGLYASVVDGTRESSPPSKKGHSTDISRQASPKKKVKGSLEDLMNGKMQ
jgi:hypothetical protein